MKKVESQSPKKKVNKTKANPKPTSSDSDSGDDSPQANKISTNLYRVAAINNFSKNTPRLPLEFTHRNGSFFYNCLPDSGATISVVSHNLAKRYRLRIRSSSDKLFACDDSELVCLGTTTLRTNGHKIIALVCSSIKDDILISWHDLANLGVLPSNFPSLPSGKVCSTATDNIDLIKRDFSDVLTDDLPSTPMAGSSMKIDLITDRPIEPKKVYKTRPVPVHWQSFDETSDWVSPAFFVPKPNGKVRLVTDFTHLNKFIKRPVHPFPSAGQIIQNIPTGSKYFAKLDATQGYHQVPLHPDSRHLTTFLLPWGKYRYLRGPMGLKSTNDVFCAKSDKVICPKTA